jgi:hypothetical protein
MMLLLGVTAGAVCLHQTRSASSCCERQARQGQRHFGKHHIKHQQHMYLCIQYSDRNYGESVLERIRILASNAWC